VLFNRFYQPDIDVEQLDVMRVNLSSSSELLLRLRWLAILSGRVRASLGATGGVHTAIDAVKAVMAGAQAADARQHEFAALSRSRGPRARQLH
jgi:dihydroorotate dehydrogenase (fumarate)